MEGGGIKKPPPQEYAFKGATQRSIYTSTYIVAWPIVLVACVARDADLTMAVGVRTSSNHARSRSFVAPANRTHCVKDRSITIYTAAASSRFSIAFNAAASVSPCATACSYCCGSVVLCGHKLKGKLAYIGKH